MKKNLTEMVFILDKSGSMAGLEADTIGGFNSMIERQKQAEGEALASTVLFANSSTVIHDRVDLRKIEPLTDRQYYVGGGTALIDAIGADRSVTFKNDHRGQQLNYDVVGKAVLHMRECAAPMSASWKEDIEEDVRKRGR